MRYAKSRARSRRGRRRQIWGPAHATILMTGLFWLLASTAFAHTDEGVAGGLVSGLLHPVLGMDHLVAMVAVGLWGAQLGSPALWLLPVAFPMMMALGALLGLAGLPLPFIEVGIALSALALGVAVAGSLRPPLWAALSLVAAFAVFHGHAHGSEVPAAANPLAYGVGFVVATGLLHLSGILLGALVRFPRGAQLVRLCGALVALVGVFFLAADLGFAP